MIDELHATVALPIEKDATTTDRTLGDAPVAV